MGQGAGAVRLGQEKAQSHRSGSHIPLELKVQEGRRDMTVGSHIMAGPNAPSHLQLITALATTALQVVHRAVPREGEVAHLSPV